MINNKTEATKTIKTPKSFIKPGERIKLMTRREEAKKKREEEAADGEQWQGQQREDNSQEKEKVKVIDERKRCRKKFERRRVEEIRSSFGCSRALIVVAAGKRKSCFKCCFLAVVFMRNFLWFHILGLVKW